MSIFELHCCRESDANKEIFFYNNETSELLDRDHKEVEVKLSSGGSMISHPCNHEFLHVGPSIPGRKSELDTHTVKILMGTHCNNSCKYCVQDISSSVDCMAIPVDKLIEFIPTSTRLIHFWGGEPLLYWDILKPLAEGIRSKLPETAFYTSTNGHLLDYDKNSWLESLGFCVGLSHDGPGQWLRGKDPLQDDYLHGVIQDLFNRLSDRNRFSFNPTLTKQNSSRREIEEFFVNEIGHYNFNLGEGTLFHPSLPKHKEFCFTSHPERIQYRLSMLSELRSNLASKFNYVSERTGTFVQSIYYRRNWESLGFCCGIGSEGLLIFDVAGNVLTCQNVCSYDINDDGYSHIIGNINNLAGVRLNTVTEWWYRDICRKCPVLQLCAGGCAITPNSVWSDMCNNNFCDFIAFFAHSIEKITGYLPYYIKGNQPDDRKDIFDIIANGEEDHIFV